MRSLITGIGGFAGRYLAEAAVRDGDTVAGFGIPSSLEEPAAFPEGVELFAGDIRDSNRLTEVLTEVRPEAIFHLAALSHVGDSWAFRRETLDVNVLGTDALLEAREHAAPESRMVLVSTGQVYGKAAAAAMPLSEDHPADPQSPYAASKLCAETLALQAVANGAHVVIVRPFNFAGPGQQPSFVCSDFARQIAWAEARHAPATLVVGNLDARRDFTDVRDIVEGFRAAVRVGRAGRMYNLASGRATAIRELLDTLLSMAEVEIEVRSDPERLRPADVPLFVGDASRAREELGWAATTDLKTTLRDTLAEWRRCARSAGAVDA